MPTFTAVALDRLFEPRTSKSMSGARDVPESRLQRWNSTPVPRSDKGSASGTKQEKGIGPSTSKHVKRNNIPSPMVDRKHHWTQISPALYATPESTPLPDSPSSFPPSPYIINHKRRGPRLLKSFSEDDVATRQQDLDKKKVEDNVRTVEQEVVGATDSDSSVPKDNLYSDKDESCKLLVNGSSNGKYVNGPEDAENGRTKFVCGSSGQNGTAKAVTFYLQQDGDNGDSFDPQDSVSAKSNSESETNGGVVEQSLNSTTPMAEFYDAWEELSSESGPVPQLPVNDVEAELREIRLSLLMEIEKRKQAEEALSTMRVQWQNICKQLSLVGLTLPVDPTALIDEESEKIDDPAKDLEQQVYIARFVSNSIGRGVAKAEVEIEMEAQIKLKNFEINRLTDRLHYFETVNREMSQRNQETIDTARRLRQRRKRRQRWIWGSIAAAIAVGSTVLAWSYLSSSKVPSPTNESVQLAEALAPENDDSSIQ